MSLFWHDWLYNPLLNVLIWLYQGPAMESLGLAVVMLTVVLRLALLPLSVVDERNRLRYERLNRRIESIERDFKTDHVKRKERIRELLKEHKVSYWSKVLGLAFQLLVLVLLYQVFLAGLRFTNAETLYAWVQAPAMVDTRFLGFDLAAHSLLWAGAVGVLLFLQIYSVQKQREHLVTRSDVMYLFLFPIFSTIVLMLLPMVKSLFVLTSMLFSMLVHLVRMLLVKPAAEEA
jgi:YidC/Oxa1 family membrane protein insertase